MIYILIASGFIVILGWWNLERRRRKRFPVAPGLQAHLHFPHEEEFELYHNALSLCSMKTRVCLAELGIHYRSHHIDLIETGAYENIRKRLLDVNPAGTVPVLLHNGHPIYESHEQIRYAALQASPDRARLIPGDPVMKKKMEEWVDRSSITHDPVNNGDVSAANAVPGITLPLFSSMIKDIDFWQISEGLLFHFHKVRPLLFIVLKLFGLKHYAKLKPIVKIGQRSHRQLHHHLDILENQLSSTEGEWILGAQYSLADVSWTVIFERLVQADCLNSFIGKLIRPACWTYWQALKDRPSYREAILEHSHPTIARGTARLKAEKMINADLRVAVFADNH